MTRQLSSVATAAAAIRAELRGRPASLADVATSAISVTSERASMLRSVTVRVVRTGVTEEETLAMGRDIWTVVRRHWWGSAIVIVTGRRLGELC
ncbi:hypothetical protein [Candidatus Frankia alpina]|uniref:Uncharacterized protein n=1 Tax=Candidatus Frankia alpina TaxID=2699483 RepID=A0A4S5DYE6_9ACTN|nr:hypothetical protein [Candidatus Frankia alpina]THJ63976.1 hypothetical protein E7Y31_17925 [Candidatus Frankia alpina]